MKQHLQLDDFTKYHFLSGLKLSPKGSSAAFIDQISNLKDNGYDAFIRLISLPDGNVIKLTTSGKEGSFIYDDENTLLFPAVRNEADKPEPGREKTVFYRISTRGGEAERAFELPYTVIEIQKIKEHLYAFIARCDWNRPDPESTDKDDLKDFPDYHVLEELPYWSNGAGFVSGIRMRLGIFHADTGEQELITGDHFQTYGLAVSGDTILYFGQCYDEVLGDKPGIYSYDLTTGQTSEILPQGQMVIHGIAPAEDGFYFLGTDQKKRGGNQSCDLCFYDGRIHILDDQMLSVGPTPASDCLLGGGSPFFVRENTLYYRPLERTRCPLYAWKEKPEQIIGDPDVSCEAFDVNEAYTVYVGMKPGRLQEVYLYDRVSHETRQLTHLNDEILKDKYIGTCEYIPFTNSDGIDIDGWIIKPYGYDPDKSYPGILDMHGGPRVALGTNFFHEMQYWANEGYFVFFCNPRGSDGRGDTFADIRGRWGDVDYRDFMEFVDHVIRITTNLDTAHLGVTGGSYGGWMTNWIIGHTHRFAAAASQRSFSNWLSDFGCSEIGFSFDPEEIGANPWQDPQFLWDRSPVKYVQDVTTPTLFIHSLQDYNCPFSEGMQMFSGLKFHHVPSRVCAFEGENHNLSRSGKPRHRIRRLKEITDWMNQYLKD